MNTSPTYPRTYSVQPTVDHGLWRVLRFLKLIFISGPRVLLTSQISIKCAVAMIIMCLPALSFSALLTLPGLVFQSPQQNAYFYFAKVLEQDPTRWIVLSLTGLCVLLSLALPATMERPTSTTGY